MNVIISNKYKDALSNLNIDVIKKLDGEFDVDTLIETFSNFYFNRMILDISALKDHFNVAVLQKLSASLDASKIILFLDDDPRINNGFLSQIISLGIYNFTRDITGVTYLMENPNSYRDVAQYHDLALHDQENLISDNTSSSVNGAHNGGFVHLASNTQSEFVSTGNVRVYGFKDLTDDAGATSLIYMLKKQMSGRKVLAIEVNSNDFSYFDDPELMSINDNQIGMVRNKFKNFDVVFIDLNNSNLANDGTCDEILYLLEPSTIKLNTLIRHNKMALQNHKSEKIILNKSMLTQSDVKVFEYESGVEIFYNLPPLDERKDSQLILDSFLEKLGIYKPVFTGNDSSESGEAPKGDGFFNSIFKK